MIRRLSIVLLLAASCGHAAAADWYVSPTGTPQGNGTIESPWDLATAIGHRAQPAARHEPGRLPPQLQPGDCVLLLPGVYVGAFDSHLHAGMTLTAASGRPVIDLATPSPAVGGRRFYCWGNDATYSGFEIRSSGRRKTGQTGPWPSEIDLGGLVTYGTGIWYRDLWIHDLEGAMSSQSGGGVTDCLIWCCGWLGGDNAHGHGLYVQNRADGGAQKLIARNVSFGNFGYGIHAYGTNGSLLNKIRLEGNVCFDNGGAAGSPYSHFPNLFVGGQMPAKDIEVVGNYTYSTQQDNVARFGYPWGPAGGLLLLQDNVFACGRLDLVKPFSPLTSSGNLLVGTMAGLPVTGVSTEVPGSLVRRSGKLVVVYNWARALSVSIDLGLSSGQRFQLHSVTDLATPVLTGAYAGPVDLPMTPRPLPRPAGYSERAPVVLDETFGCYLLTAGDITQPDEPVPPVEPDDPPPPAPEFDEVRLFRERSTGRLFVEENGVKKPL